MRLKYIITGTGRCGTVYLARVLTELEILCGHEAIFDCYGIDVALDRIKGERPLKLSDVSMMKFEGTHCSVIPEWLPDINEIVADSSYLAAPYLQLFDVDFIHLVRDPIKVVNSFCNYINYFKHPYPSDPYGMVYEEFVYKYVPELHKPMTQYERACLYYVRWNQMIEKNLEGKKFIFHRIEDNLQPVLEFVGASGDVRFTDTKVNSFEKTGKTFSLNDIKNSPLKRDFIDMGRRYGYPMDSENLLI
jgi:hypothetical protein